MSYPTKITQESILDPGVEPVVEVWYYDVPLDEPLQDYIREVCAVYHVSMDLVIAIIEHESSFRANVISGTNDYGLMQINSINHPTLSTELGVSDFLNPYENVLCGIYLISGHLEATDGDVGLALMRYNRGAAGARKLWKEGIYETTYSQSILRLYDSYKEKSRPADCTP